MATTLVSIEPTVVQLQPRFEGSNICSWIGFKHVMYLVEEAILADFQHRGMPPRWLFEQQGLCVEIVDSSVRILHALHMDDSVRIEVQPKTTSGAAELSFAVQMLVNREGKELKALTGNVKVLLRKDRTAEANASVPHFLMPHVVPEIRRQASNGAHANKTTLNGTYPDGYITGRGTENPPEAAALVPQGANAFVWKWRIPYFYCHFSERIQHSGYLRIMEEVVDLFLASRGISIRSMLDRYGWIPVVPSARVEILAEALMEEELYIAFTVEDVYKDVTYTARMDCYVERDGSFIHTATGRITHGYAEILNRCDWKLVNFNEDTLNALRGPVR